MNKPISVIVPTRHRDDMLALCLDRLAPGAQTLPFSEYEVVVTDNGQTSTAEKMMKAQYPWAKWVAGPGGGPADNRNNGVRNTTGDWLAFTDDDCLPEPDWLSSFVEARDAAEPGVRALEGAIHPLGDIDNEMASCPTNLEGGCFWTANVFIERRVFDEVHGFDTSFPGIGGEDFDLHLRLKKKTRIPFVPQARVFHPVRIFSMREAIRVSQTENLVWAHCVRSHPDVFLRGENSPPSIVLYMIKSQLVSVYWHLKRGHFRRGYARFAAIPGAIVAIVRHLKKRAG